MEYLGTGRRSAERGHSLGRLPRAFLLSLMSAALGILHIELSCGVGL
jgi:hypothetical protein